MGALFSVLVATAPVDVVDAGGPPKIQDVQVFPRAGLAAVDRPNCPVASPVADGDSKLPSIIEG
jgi:hypothetical protein